MKTGDKKMQKKMNFSLKDKKRIAAVILSVFGMGFTLSFLIRLALGTDPCSCMNTGIASTLGLTFGTWSALVNSFLMIIVFFIDRSMIGWGTVFNMLLIGYIADFVTWLSHRWISDETILSEPTRIIFLLVMLPVFIFSAAVYMNADLGLAPYDAIALLISRKIKVKYAIVRMIYDFTACFIGFLFGGTLGPITIALALFLGPAVAFVGHHIEKIIPPRES